MVGIDARPVLNGWQDVGARHVGKRQVVLRGKSEDIADAFDTLSAEEERTDVFLPRLTVRLSSGAPYKHSLRTIRRSFGFVLGLLLFDGGKVIDKGKRLLVVGVLFA